MTESKPLKESTAQPPAIDATVAKALKTLVRAGLAEVNGNQVLLTLPDDPNWLHSVAKAVGPDRTDGSVKNNSVEESIVIRFQELERGLCDRFPQACKEAKALAENLTDPQTASADAVWARLWNKPLYANTKVATGTRWVERLAPHMDGAWRSWGLQGEAVYIAKVGSGISPESFRRSEQADEIRRTTRIPIHRLFAIQGAARALRERASRCDRPYADLVDADPDAIVSTVRQEMGWGWGNITVLHFLTDLGLACKPDVHLVRTVRHLGIVLNLSDQKVPGLTAVIEINCAVRSLLESVYGSFTPQKLRYLDKVLMEISRQKLI
ncbi:MAG TPA: hypothetical protein VGR96_08760 [Acidobacteriaceae bacterium]|nr:hypothetical protein [Acidobacteriaceae bacterium]